MKRINRLIYGWIDKLFLGGCSNYNSLAVRKSCRSKLQARQVFAAHGIPHAQGRVFLSPYTAHCFAREHGFPLVIKPNVSGFSRGSHFPITSFGQLWLAALLVKIWWPYSVVERYLEGRNYRVVVARGRILSILRRYPAFVDGDGHSTISQLIDRENGVRQEMGLLPVISAIPKNGAVRAYLRKKQLDFDSVPGQGKRVQLFNRITLASGGVVETLEQHTMPQVNQELFLKVLDLFKANILGIDAIFEKGIETPYSEQRCIFLEVNSRPYLKMHHFPRFGKQQDLSATLDELAGLEVSNSDIF